MSDGSLIILSCGLGTLPPDEAATLHNAEVIYGSKKLLSLLEGRASTADLRPIAAKAAEDAATALDLAMQGRRVVVLASGDALFHGMGGVLARLLTAIPPDQRPVVRFVPGITAFQALFHRLGLPWDQARLFSIHHADALPLRAMLDAPLAVIYAGSACTAAQLAAALLQTFPEATQRRAVLADSLNTPDERLAHGSLAELAEETVSPTSILLLLPPTSEDVPMPPVFPLGLPVNAYEREAGLITAPEVRAVILSKLRLPAWGHLWDIGAGSGSIGLEAAALRPDLRVTAVERSSARSAMIQRNAARMGLANHQTVTGDFPDVLNSLSLNRSAPPACADRIVMGGGGAGLTVMLDAALERLSPGGHMVVPVVTLESQHRLYHWRPDLRTALLTIQIAEERPLAGSWHHLEPQRPIHLYCYAKLQGTRGTP